MSGGLYKEPGGGRRAWVFVLIAGYFFVETLFFRHEVPDRLVFLTFGIAVLLFGFAELVPRNRTGLAGALRIGGIVLMVLILILRTLQLVAFIG
jgi:hypothetical protein